MTSRASRPVVSLLIALGLAFGLSGCRGNGDLWDRYRSERMLWRARRLAAGASADRDRSARAASAVEAVVVTFPAATWTSDAAWARPLGPDVARISATAALLRAGMDEDAGRDAGAEARYARVAAEWGRVDSAHVLAFAGRARCLERLDRDAEALGAWLALASHDVAPGPGGEARRWLLESPARASAWLVAMGQPARADSLRRASAMALEAAAARLGAATTATDVRLAAAGLLDGAGDFAEARRELRGALGTATTAPRRATLWLAMVRSAAEQGAPDSAEACLDAMESEIHGPPARFAELALARSWDRAGVADSALAVYKRLVERSPEGADPSAAARLERALLLERQGRWEIARADLRTLATLFPASPSGLAARVRIVRHSVELGETELANVEARHALLELEDQLTLQGDPDARIRIRMARAQVMAMSGEGLKGLDDLDVIWRQDPHRATAIAAGWLAARLADSALARPDRARDGYTRLARQSKDLEIRRMARERLEHGTR